MYVVRARQQGLMGEKEGVAAREIERNAESL